ncbi:LOW QUALITY PROTEIN: hypothetical protein PHMEG_00030575 [Phytophthora megakarya]|uniref:Uncharacterized protein n=1 Tax=Phytophthora megakarya TaxID=4795 RepID=A0A225UYG2_9STRA|nr:LOW QUALITY PROTEIN: hypothetical protein PHMEG_00030575 [Phytophthora megakarya]
MINDILKWRDRKTIRDTSQAERGLKEQLATTETAAAWTSRRIDHELNSRMRCQSRSYDHGYEENEDSFGDGERRADENRHLMSTIKLVKPSATTLRQQTTMNVVQLQKGQPTLQRGPARDNRSGRLQYGPHTVCGGLTHSVDYYYK